MAGADHDAVLDVDRQSADDHPSSDATERHQRDCQRPETDRPIEFGLGMPVVQPATKTVQVRE